MYVIITFVLFLTPFLCVAGGNEDTTSVNNAKNVEDGDYIGCYAQGCLFDYNPALSDSITPGSCVASCKNEEFPVAALIHERGCSCSCQSMCKTKMNDTFCQRPCKRDERGNCIGFVVFLYRVRAINTVNRVCSEADNQPPSDDGKSMLPGILTSIFVTIIVCAVVVSSAVIVYRWLHKTNAQSADVGASNAGNMSSPGTKPGRVSFQDGSGTSQAGNLERLSRQLRKPSLKPRLSISTVIKDISRKRPESSSADSIYSEAHYGETSIASSVKRARQDSCDDQDPDSKDHDHINPTEKPNPIQRKFMASRITKDGYLVPELPLPKPPSIKKYYSFRFSRASKEDKAVSSEGEAKEDDFYYEFD